MYKKFFIKLNKQEYQSHFVILLKCLIVIMLLIPILSRGQDLGNIMRRPILGTDKILFIRVIYPDDKETILTDDRAPLHAQALKNIFETNSYGAYTLDIDITPILTMPQPSTFYKLENRLSFVRIRSDAIKVAEEAGFQINEYDREAIFTKKIWLQEFLGVGGVNLRTYYSSRDNASLSAHELGHTFDWRHASFWRVSSKNPIDTIGELIEYGDKFDIMGDALNPHHFNPWYKARAGWIPENRIKLVSASGVFTIEALENSPDSSSEDSYHALRIRRSPGTDYWVFYRSQEDSVNDGALIVRAHPRNTSHSTLLDMNPASKPLNRDYEDAALLVGQAVKDEEAGIEITVLSRNADSLVVGVQIPSEQIASVPVINFISPPQTAGVIKGEVTFEATVYNPDDGKVNGAGIDTVVFRLGYPEGEDPFGEGTTFIPLTQKVFTSPPYKLSLNSDDLPDEAYRLQVGALTSVGIANIATLNHIIDNTGPSTTTSNKFQIQTKVFAQLHQNFPNPFSLHTNIDYSILQSGKVELWISDTKGDRIKTLINHDQVEGSYTMQWHGKNEAGQLVSNGLYFCQLRVGNQQITRGMILLK